LEQWSSEEEENGEPAEYNGDERIGNGSSGQSQEPREQEYNGVHWSTAMGS
jgi:hypothetical protein